MKFLCAIERLKGYSKKTWVLQLFDLILLILSIVLFNVAVANDINNTLGNVLYSLSIALFAFFCLIALIWLFYWIAMIVKGIKLSNFEESINYNEVAVIKIFSILSIFSLGLIFSIIVYVLSGSLMKKLVYKQKLMKSFKNTNILEDKINEYENENNNELEKQKYNKNYVEYYDGDDEEEKPNSSSNYSMENLYIKNNGNQLNDKNNLNMDYENNLANNNKDSQIVDNNSSFKNDLINSNQVEQSKSSLNDNTKKQDLFNSQIQNSNTNVVSPSEKDYDDFNDFRSDDYKFDEKNFYNHLNELDKAYDLKKSGIISDEEFQKIKNTIFDKEN